MCICVERWYGTWWCHITMATLRKLPLFVSALFRCANGKFSFCRISQQAVCECECGFFENRLMYLKMIMEMNNKPNFNGFRFLCFFPSLSSSLQCNFIFLWWIFRCCCCFFGSPFSFKFTSLFLLGFFRAIAISLASFLALARYFFCICAPVRFVWTERPHARNVQSRKFIYYEPGVVGMAGHMSSQCWFKLPED